MSRPGTQLMIVGLGEVLWDLFPDEAKFGGAPANFAYHAGQLGAKAVTVSAVGRDELGEKALEKLRSVGMSTEFVQINQYPTGRVHVTLDDRGHASYRFEDNCAWDHLEWRDELKELAASLHGVCFGTLCQRSFESGRTIQEFLAHVPSDRIKVYDINIRPPFYSNEVILRSLELANVFKLNDDELPIVAEIVGVQGAPVDQMKELCHRFKLRLIALTRGQSGAMLVSPDEVVEQAGVEVKIKDTVGAGDSFTAALVMGLLDGKPLPEIARSACELAAFVCTQSGATPEYDASRFR
jgi:fructokinase